MLKFLFFRLQGLIIFFSCQFSFFFFKYIIYIFVEKCIFQDFCKLFGFLFLNTFYFFRFLYKLICTVFFR